MGSPTCVALTKPAWTLSCTRICSSTSAMFGGRAWASGRDAKLRSTRTVARTLPRSTARFGRRLQASGTSGAFSVGRNGPCCFEPFRRGRQNAARPLHRPGQAHRQRPESHQRWHPQVAPTSSATPARADCEAGAFCEVSAAGCRGSHEQEGCGGRFSAAVGRPRAPRTSSCSQGICPGSKRQ